MAYEPKGDYKRAPIFTGKNYSYWKACMRIHVNSYDKGVWGVIQNGPTPVTHLVDGVVTPKSEALWNDNDKKNTLNLIKLLNALGNHISNAIATNKILRCLTRNWEPKVTTIKEANDLTKVDLTTFFGKL